jgi:two-component system NtrC family response regulator
MMQKQDILIVEDERAQREMLRDFLAKEGHRVSVAENGEEAIKLVREKTLDLVVMDFKMPGRNGLEVLKDLKQINPELDVVMVTAYGTIETAVEAMKAGSIDYITKPIELDELLLILKKAAERKTLIRENETLKRQIQEKGVSQDQIVYKSARMAELINLAGRIANSKASVLVEGESGTGKELFASLIHTLSPRAGKVLITVNCGALTESIIESELFGHEKGAFTGAHQRRIGRFEQADGGSLFMDEIGELSPSVQVKLLRFLQEGEFQRVGGSQVLRADVRLISATNRNLESEVRRGTFREDLFFRLNVITLKVPPLRERREDIPALIEHFVRSFAADNHKNIEGVTKEARDLLMKYDYPGNVRELENIIERAVVISRGNEITTDDLPFAGSERYMAASEEKGGVSLKKRLEGLEYKLVKEALEAAGGNQTQAAAILGLGERMLRYKLKKYRIK